jgi:hypothetical protein
MGRRERRTKMRDEDEKRGLRMKKLIELFRGRNESKRLMIFELRTILQFTGSFYNVQEEG